MLVCERLSQRDLGAWFDECMTMNKHVSKVCSKAFGAR